MQARDVEPEIQVPEEEGVVEAIGEVLSHQSPVVVGEEIVNGQLTLDEYE